MSFILSILLSLKATQRGYLGNVPFLQPYRLVEKMLSVQNDFDLTTMALINQSLLLFNLHDGVLISDLLGD